MDHPTPPRVPSRSGAVLAGLLLPAGFLGLAAFLFLMPATAGIPLEPQTIVRRADLTVSPRRQAMPDPPRTLVEGLPQNCNACHRVFQSAHGAGVSPNYHAQISLRHGLNNRCINCHDPVDREKLTLRDGTPLAFSETPRLCSQCHGTVFRDWERGTHGKTLGSWVMNSPQQRRLGCNECHDPHSPRYERMTPLPGPNTLRMGNQQERQELEEGGPLQPLLRTPRTHPQPTVPPGDHP